MGSSIANEKYLNLVLPPLLSRWSSLGDDDTDLFPLLECLSHICGALGPKFAQYTKPIYDRCVSTIEKYLVAASLHQQNPNIEPPIRDFLTVSLDMISSLCNALGREITGLVVNSKLIPLLMEILKDSSADFSQSSFALVGDLARYCSSSLTKVVPVIVPILIEGTYHFRLEAMCNNAYWALSEIIIAVSENRPMDSFPPQFRDHAQKILERCLIVFKDESVSYLLETVAVVIGRLGWVCPHLIVQSLPPILRPLCIALRNLPDDIEKEEGLRGLCEMIRTKPEVVLPEFQTFCDLVVSWNGHDPELKHIFTVLLTNFKSKLGSQWNKIFRSFSNHLQNQLINKYQL
jgi:transportin-1